MVKKNETEESIGYLLHLSDLEVACEIEATQHCIPVLNTLPQNLDPKFHWFSSMFVESLPHCNASLTTCDWRSDRKRVWNLMCRFYRVTMVTRSTRKPQIAETASNAEISHYLEKNIYQSQRRNGVLQVRQSLPRIGLRKLCLHLLTDCIWSLVSLAFMSSNSSWIELIAVVPKGDQRLYEAHIIKSDPISTYVTIWNILMRE